MTSTIISDVRTKQALPYGGIPYDLITKHYEETNPALIDANKYSTPFTESEYDNYVRAEIVDWSPDVPYFESDHARRDPALSRSQLNLRYNSTRGSRPELPRHPEMFIGFVENDPRGALLDPRMDQMRGHMSAQAANLTVSMGNNDDFSLAERPWTAQSLSYDMKYIQQQQKKNMKIFTTEKDGRPYSRNLVLDAPTWGTNQSKIRKSNMDGGEETLDINHASSRGDYGEYVRSGGFVNTGVKGVDAGRFSNVPTNSWINTKTDHDFYDQNGNHLRNYNASNNQTGIAVKNIKTDHDSYDSYKVNSSNKKVLGASMGLAARNNKNRKNSQQDTDFNSEKQNFVNAGHLQPSEHVGKIYRNIQESQDRTPIHPEDNMPINMGFQVQQNLGQATKKSDYKVELMNQVNRINNVNMIIKGLKEGSASGKRKIKDQVVANLSIAPTVDFDNNVSKFTSQSTDYGKVKHKTEFFQSPFLKSELAEGVTVQQYKQKMPAFEEQKVRMGQNAHGETQWYESNHNTQYTGLQPGQDHKVKMGNYALSPTEWKNQEESRLMKGKNPELEHKVRAGNVALNPTQWHSSNENISGKNVQATQSHFMNVGQHTYNPQDYNTEFALMQNGKTQQLSNRRSALNDPTEVGTYDLFQQSNESHTGGHIVGPKSLRAGTWNMGDSREDDEHYIGDF